MYTFGKGLPFMGGFCKWYYTPRENLDGFPAIDPGNQWLSSEPALLDGATWYGPVEVPDDQLGFEEVFDTSAAGIFYKQRIYGMYPGDNTASRVLLENLPWYEFVVVGKQRAGGLWMIFGTDQLGLQLSANYKSGDGAIGTAGHEFSFLINSNNKGLILPSFAGDNTTGSTPGTNGSGMNPNQTEIIYFTDVSEVDVEWTTGRQAKFGAYPVIEVWWNNDSGGSEIAWLPINVDVAAPLQTQFTIYNGQNKTGYIILK